MNGRERAAHELWNNYNRELHIGTTIDVVLELIDAGVELTREMNI